MSWEVFPPLPLQSITKRLCRQHYQQQSLFVKQHRKKKIEMKTFNQSFDKKNLPNFKTIGNKNLLSAIFTDSKLPKNNCH
ncbi:TPA: hypothetical protein J0T37_002693 [Enterococcus faecium]|nr:hypothetical protein [Enterococcus faecium]